ncbi:hypothetical protein [Marivivens marinus]|uniref:hypothetical protein n=1 Tax=Marivivens marinus TaxID=3110173 RepID=UPI003B849500
MATLETSELAATSQSKLVSYFEDGYQRADDILAYFKKTEESFRSSFEAEFGQAAISQTASTDGFDLDDRDE